MRSLIDQAAVAIQNGGVIAYPTDTLWGLGASITHAKAVRKVFDLKKRPLDQPLSIAVASVADIERYAIVTPTARKLFELLPGPMTLILEKRAMVPSILTGGRTEVGIRVPAHDDCLRLLRQTDAITTTSANLHDGGEPTSLAQVRATFGDQVDFYLESGTAPAGQPSTIVDARSSPFRIVRTGALSESRIRKLFLD
jgi:L-threonylcarbamoyladenylate synthase